MIKILQGTRAPGQMVNGRPDGDCILTRFEVVTAGAAGAVQLRVEKADPRILISAEVMDQVTSGSALPQVTLKDGVLRIEAVNQTVVYRIVDYLMDIDCYVGEWPD
jgi:hypothetical protein